MIFPRPVTYDMHFYMMASQVILSYRHIVAQVTGHLQQWHSQDNSSKIYLQIFLLIKKPSSPPYPTLTELSCQNPHRNITGANTEHMAPGGAAVHRWSYYIIYALVFYDLHSFSHLQFCEISNLHTSKTYTYFRAKLYSGKWIVGQCTNT